MKVFLSYGHDANAPLVELLRRDLAAAGYEPWHDTREITAGDDWRRAILDGLADSHWVLGFLSKHSVREPGVCLDELAIALHHKGGIIATILLEADADPPLSVSHIQWLDMSDWAARKAAGGPAWAAWYAEKRDAILALLASPHVQRFAGEIVELEDILVPVAQQAEIATKVEGFVGRDWLLARLDAWRTTAKDSRLLWIAGAAGTGKSAFAAWLGHRGKVNVVGLNLCAYNQDDRRDAGRVIRTLAFQIASRLPDYRRLLLDRLKRQKPELDRQTPATLFSTLLAEPLGRAIDGGRRTDRVLVVIDALDETVTDGHSELAEVLAAEAPKLPPWIAIVVTSRPDEPIKRKFGGLNPLTLDAASPDNLADLRDYIRAWLGDAAANPPPHSGGGGPPQAVEGAPGARTIPVDTQAADSSPRTQGTPAPSTALRAVPVPSNRHPIPLRGRGPLPHSARFTEEDVERIVAASEGNFLYVRMLREAVAAGTLRLDAPTGLPRGLGALYERWFRHRFPTKAAYEPFVPLLQVLVAAEHPVPEAWLARMFGWSPLDLARALEGLGSLFEQRPEGVAPFHKSLRDWLGDPKSGPFALDVAEGTRHLASALFAFTAWTALEEESTLNNFWLVELPVQTGRSTAEDRRALLDARGGWDRVRRRTFDVARAHAKIYAWAIALAWWDMVASLAGTTVDRPVDRAYALAECGDIELTIGRTSAALKRYCDGLAIRQRLLAADPNNVQLQRDLVVSLDKVGDMLVAQGDRVGALESFREGLSIAQRLAAADGGNSDWQSDLVIFHNKIGDILVAQGDRPGALEGFRDGLAIRERLVAADPGNAKRQRDLSASYDKIGDVLVTQDNCVGALKSFRDAFAIRKSLAAADPDNVQWRRNLSISYDKIGDLLVTQGDRVGALENFRDASAIRERLATADPDNVQWRRDLSISYDAIGNVLIAQNDRSGALENFREGCAIRERLAAADPDNTDWQRDLSISYDRIGDALLVQGEGAAALRSFRNALSVQERLVAADPQNTVWQHDLSISRDNVGKVLLALPDRIGALASFRKGLAIRKSLVAIDSKNAGWQRSLSISFCYVGDVHAAQGDRADALTNYRDGLAIVERLATADPSNAIWQRDLISFCVKIADVVPTDARSWLSWAKASAERLRNDGRLAEADAWMPDEIARRIAALGGLR